jgi:hypothetical protein
MFHNPNPSDISEHSFPQQQQPPATFPILIPPSNSTGVHLPPSTPTPASRASTNHEAVLHPHPVLLQPAHLPFYTPTITTPVARSPWLPEPTANSAAADSLPSFATTASFGICRPSCSFWRCPSHSRWWIKAEMTRRVRNRRHCAQNRHQGWERPFKGFKEVSEDLGRP